MSEDLASNQIEKIDNLIDCNSLSGSIMPDIDLQADLKGKVNNLVLSKSNALLPVFEAVANSIEAIEERNETFNITDRGHITVRVIREENTQIVLSNVENGTEESEESEDKKKITGFEIVDDGIGFNENNFNSFCIADTTYKLSKGCKGVGRFYWLKAFDNVEIDSTYFENDNIERRRINFSENSKKISMKFEQVNKSSTKTIVRLKGFKNKYASQSKAFKTAKKIAQRILEHNLSYYIAEEAPSISVVDGETTINLDQFFNNIRSAIYKEIITIGGHLFKIVHIKLPETTSDMHNIVLCAHKREVITESISKYLGTSFQLDDKGTKFYYTVYVSSDYLDTNVNITRTDFDIDKQTTIVDFPKEGKNKIITKERIIEEVLKKSREYLSKYLENIERTKRDRIANLVVLNPSLRAVPKYCPEIYDEIQANSSDEGIYDILYKYKGRAEYKIQKNTEKLLNKSKGRDVKEIKNECEKLVHEIEDFQKDNLTGYVLYRKKIIDLLKKGLESKEDGTYSYEDLIHNLVFPMGTSSDEIDNDNLNMWIIDELLVFHDFAKSNKALKKFTHSQSKNRPDIFICCESDDEYKARSVAIIEFKRTQEDKFNKNPVEQMYDIIDLIIEENKLLKNNTPISVTPFTRYYCYAICDINEEMKKYIDRTEFRELKDGAGYYYYNSRKNAHIEILTYKYILADVQKRHKIFFEKLGIPQNI